MVVMLLQFNVPVSEHSFKIEKVQSLLLKVLVSLRSVSKLDLRFQTGITVYCTIILSAFESVADFEVELKLKYQITKKTKL